MILAAPDYLPISFVNLLSNFLYLSIILEKFIEY